LLRSSDARLRAEAALALTSWRVFAAVGVRAEETLVAELRGSSFRAAAAVRLASLGSEDGAALDRPLDDGDEDSDEETAFAVALLRGQEERLRVALDEGELARLAAATALAQHRHYSSLRGPLRDGPAPVRRAVLMTLASAKAAAPELAAELLALVETVDDERDRERAARVLARSCTHAQALRIVDAAAGDRSIYQTLLQFTPLPSETVTEVLRRMVERRHFAMHQYGLPALAADARVADTFVPRWFASAEESTQLELLRFAEAQLEARGDEALHRFVMGVVFGDGSARLRAAAWWSLHRWYRSLGEHRGEGPLRLHVELVERFFGSVGALVPRLIAVVGDGATMREVGVYELVANLCASADDGFVAEVQGLGEPGHALARALLEALAHDYWPNTRAAMMTLASRIGAHPPWREETLAALLAVNKPGDYYYEKALARLRGEDLES
jgi:hypothetical protein